MVRAMRLFLAFAALTVVLAVAGGASAQAPTLFGTVGPGFSIRFSDAAGNPVRNLDPGTYTIQIEDKADIHNFHLSGPGVDMATDTEQMGTFVWTVTLVAGRYHYQCDPHSSTMRGDFTVGAAPPPPATPPATKPVALRATVGPGRSIVVSKAGVRLRSIAAGRAVITVNDRSAKDNFHLTGPGVNRATSKPGKRTVVWKLTLKRGLYRYRSDATPTLRGVFRVTA
jgi:plastocyanin